MIPRLELALRRDERIMRFLTVRLDKYGVKYNEDKRKGLIGKIVKKKDKDDKKKDSKPPRAKKPAPAAKTETPAPAPVEKTETPAPAEKTEATAPVEKSEAPAVVPPAPPSTNKEEE